MPIIRGSQILDSPLDRKHTGPKYPVVFDIISPDGSTSLLPDNLKMVLHVNPSSLSFSYSSTITSTQTKGGFVEEHWGGGSYTISITAASGGFKRLYTGLTNVTAGPDSVNLGGSRRQTIAYDKYLDFLALFHSNGCLFDSKMNIVYQGRIKMSFMGLEWWGWFSDSFSISEAAEKPYTFELSTTFIVDMERYTLRTINNQIDQLGSLAPEYVSFIP